MPSRLIAWNRTTLHSIETEDTVQAMLEWPDGGLGTFHMSTAVSGRPERLEIIGTKGYLQLTAGELTFRQFDQDLRDYVIQSQEMYEQPPLHPVPLQLRPGQGNHVSIYRNLHRAILQGTPLAADGSEGRLSLELANAMTYSSHHNRQIELPLDRHQYAILLDELRSTNAV
jgi:predicted dehydrogenase